MNWRFTRACTVEFALKEPICLFFPIQRGVLEIFRSEFRMLESDREFENKFREWSTKGIVFSRDSKVQAAGCCTGLAERLRAERQNKKPLAHPFTNLGWWTDLERTEDNHDAEKI
jgi:hypothetical protein